MDTALDHRKSTSTSWLLCVRQSSHLSSVALHLADAAAERPCTPDHLCPRARHMQLLVPDADNRLTAGPVLAGRKATQDEEFGLLHRSHTPCGRSVRSSLTVSHLLHTPHLWLLVKSRDDKLPIMEPLYLRLERLRDFKVTYPRHPCIFCGGPTENLFHMAVVCHIRLDDLKPLCALVFRLGSLLPPRERGVWLLTWRVKGIELVVDFLCGRVPAPMARQVGAITSLVEEGVEHIHAFQMSMVDFLAFRYNERCSRLGQLVNGCPSYPRRVHAFQTQTKSAKLPCPAPEAPRPARPVDLFGGPPDLITPALSVEMLQQRLVGHHLTSWEADVIFPLWLAVWREWHSQWEKLNLSDLGIPDLGARRRQISAASTNYESPTMVGDAPDDSVAWHVDFFG